MRYNEILKEIQEMKARDIINQFEDMYPIRKKIKSPVRGYEILQALSLDKTHTSTNSIRGDFITAFMPDDSMGMIRWSRDEGYTIGVDSQDTLNRIKKILGDIHNTDSEREKNQQRIDKRKEMLEQPEYQPGKYVYHIQLKMIGQIQSATKAGKLKLEPVIQLGDHPHVPSRAVDPKILKPVSDDFVEKVGNGEISSAKALKTLAPNTHRNLIPPEDT